MQNTTIENKDISIIKHHHSITEYKYISHFHHHTFYTSTYITITAYITNIITIIILHIFNLLPNIINITIIITILFRQLQVHHPYKQTTHIPISMIFDSLTPIYLYYHSYYLLLLNSQLPIFLYISPTIL
jgi:hypothetical protein